MIDAGISSRPASLVQVPRQPEDVRLEDVLQQREAAGHVAVERRVADRELRLVPGRDDQPAELVRERHQQDAADPRLQVLLGEVGLAAGEALGEHRVEGVGGRVDRQLPEIGAEALGEPPRVGACRLGRVARRHRDAVHALRAERLDGERGRERRVDPAGDADHDVAEAVLADVVAQAELEREPHLLELGHGSARKGSIRSPCERQSPSSTTGTSGGVPRSRASARRRTSRSRRPTASAGSMSTTSSASSNPGARASTWPSSSSTSEWPSKISSSCPPTALQKATKQELSRARVANISSRSRSRPTWNGEAEMFVSSCAPASARSVAGGPGCHMSSQIVGPTSVPPSSSSSRSRAGAK